MPLPTHRPVAVATALSCAFLAWLATTHLGPWLGRAQEPLGSWTLTASGDPGRGVLLSALYVDGVRPVPAAVERDSGWQLVDDQWLWAGGAPAALRVRGAHLAFSLAHARRGGRLELARDDMPVAAIDCEAEGVELQHRWHEAPGRAAPLWTLPLLLALLGLGARAVRPWRSDRRAGAWLAVHLTLANGLVWLGHPVGVTVDSGGYARAWADSLAHGHSDYFPPGYIAFVQLGRILPLHLGTGAQATLLQALLLTVGGLCLWRLLRSAAGAGTAFAAALLAGSLPTTLAMARSVLSEGATVAAITFALWLTLRARSSRGLGPALGAGLAGGAATVLRVTPLVTVLPFFLLHLRRGRRGVAPAAVSLAGLAAVVLAPMLWFAARSGHFELAWSSGGHVFNRLVHGQRLLDRDGPHTRALLAQLDGADPFARDHVTLRFALERRGQSSREVVALQGAVARESLRAHPLEYLAGSAVQALEQLLTPPEAAWADMHRPPAADLEDAPLLGVSVAALSWMRHVKALEAGLWPAIAVLGLGASLVFLARWRRAPLALLGLAWIVPSTLLPQAMLDIAEARRSAMLAPVLAPLAVVAVARAALAWRARTSPS